MYEELQTILYEIEIIRLNRPLTFTYKNPNDHVHLIICYFADV